MSTDSIDLSKKEPAPSDDTYIHALWLLRLVNLRRTLKVIIGLELLGFPLWLAYCGLVQSSFQKDSEVWRRLDDQILPGLITLAVVLAVTVAALVALGLPKQGLFAHARQLVPVLGRGPKVSLQHDKAGAGSAVLARLRRRGFAQPIAIVVLVIFAPIALFTAASAWPTWQANHGNGGRSFEITGGTSITEETNTFARGGGGSTTSTTYTVGTPEGTAIAESGRPESGERWLVNRDLFGNLRAYRIGAHDYLLVGVLFVVAAVAVLGALAYQAELIRRERRRRRTEGSAAGDRTMAADLVRLAGGARPELRVKKSSVGRLGVPAELAQRDPWPGLVGRKAATGVLGVGLVVALIALLAVQQANLIGAPPLYRTVVLPYLDAAGYEPETDISYQTERETGTLRSWTGSEVTRTRTLRIKVSEEPEGRSSTRETELLVARADADPGATVQRWEDDLAGNGTIPIDVSDVSGLPDGWAGRWVVTRYRRADDAELHVLTVVDGVLLELTINAEYLSDGDFANYPQRQIVAWADRLATALQRTGLARLAADTDRPESA